MEKESVVVVVKTEQKKERWPDVRALYSQPQSTASAENDIKSLFLSLTFFLSRIFYLLLLLFKKYEKKEQYTSQVSQRGKFPEWLSWDTSHRWVPVVQGNK